MTINNTELSTIEQAFEMLSEEQQTHSKRVAEYCKIVFKKICAMDMYVSVPKADRELVIENIDYVYEAALYHDIGKILPEEEPVMTTDGSGENGYILRDHTRNGIKVFEQLYPKYDKIPALHRNMIRDGIRDHHETMNGGGTPLELSGDRISYTGRIVAIANMLDNRAMALKSEDPISEVLKQLKREDAAAGFIDTEFIKAFTASGSQLKKVFSKFSEGSMAVPQTDQWIKRKSSRPMELWYKSLFRDGEQHWFSEMHFKEDSKNTFLYEDVKQIISANKLGEKLGIYFVYEILDAYRRFKTLGLRVDRMHLVLVPFFINARGLAKKIQKAFEDEDLSVEDFYFGIDHDIWTKPGKIATKNIEDCRALGINLMDADEMESIWMLSEDEFDAEESIVSMQLSRLQRM